MGGHGSGRLNKTDAFLKKNSDPFKTVSSHVASVGDEVLVLPNHSGVDRFIKDTGDIWVRVAGDTMTGKLGIGATSPNADLDIVETTAGNIIFRLGRVETLDERDVTFKTPGGTPEVLQIFAAGISSVNIHTTASGDFTKGDWNFLKDVFMNGNVGIGTTSPDGKLHVFEGTAGDVTANTAADGLIVEDNTDTGISIITPDGKFSNLFFGAASSNTGALIRWKHSTKILQMGTNFSASSMQFLTDAGTLALNIDSSQNFNFQDGNLTTTGTLASGNLNVTGTGTFSSDLTITSAGELKGSKHTWMFGHNDSFTVSGTQFMKATDGVQMTTTKAFTAIRAGSIVGISMNYDVSAVTLFPALTLRVLVNGSVVWSNSISSSVATDKEVNFTQARGTDTFSAGDTIAIEVSITGGVNGDNVSVDEIIGMLEVYYDD